jgi:G:T-mismatch repair DNA endonuclease (very short patch repair protein)
MARVRSKDTLPELIVRNLCFSMGFRYRLHVKRLPARSFWSMAAFGISTAVVGALYCRKQESIFG